jgi:hypothetical protein
MKRPVVLVSRLIVIVLVVMMAVSGCGSTSAAPHISAGSPVSKPSAAAKSAPGALPGLSSQCDQNTRPQIVPDNSQTAALPGGATTVAGLLAGMNAHRGVAGFDFAWAPGIDTPVPTVLGVVCPKTGDVYQYGDPVAWAHSVRIINRDPAGSGVIFRGSGMYSHLASEALSGPCQVLLQVAAPDKDKKRYLLDLGLFTGIIFANGDMIETQPIDPNKVG